MNSEIKKRYHKLILWYLRFKDTRYYGVIFYGGIIFISVLLIVFVVLPQFGNWVSVQNEVNATKSRIETMRSNLRFLQRIDETRLADDFTTATSALPSDREVPLVLAALNYAAIQAGVSMDDFAFQAGKVSSRGVRTQADNAPETDAKITFSVQGTLPQITTFLRYLQEKTPVFSLSSVDASFSQDNTTRITLVYHYKPLPLYREDIATPLRDLSVENRALLDRLRGWKTPVETEFIPIGSESASPL